METETIHICVGAKQGGICLHIFKNPSLTDDGAIYKIPKSHRRDFCSPCRELLVCRSCHEKMQTCKIVFQSSKIERG